MLQPTVSKRSCACDFEQARFGIGMTDGYSKRIGGIS
jgi:hypothetical protein